MPSRPDAPDDAPQYLAEGMPKQDDETLRALREWIDQLLANRREVAPAEVEEGKDEAVRDVQESEEGTIVIKEVTCGKENCKCQQGELHGPYEYLVRRTDGGLEWEYRGPVE